MHDWADPHIVSWLDYQGLRSCAVVSWATIIVSGLDVLLLSLSLKRRPRAALLIGELLLGLGLLFAACVPCIEFLAPFWQMEERNKLSALLNSSLTWREMGLYLACLSGLGLLCHLALSRSVCVRRALLWSTAPALLGAAAIYIGTN